MSTANIKHMTFEEFVEFCKTTYDSEQLRGQDMQINAAMGLSAKSGDVTQWVLDWVFRRKSVSDATAVEKLGDILWYVLYMCDALGIDPQMVIDSQVEKQKANGKFTASDLL